jgi:MSHA biogenesis protein MshK
MVTAINKTCQLAAMAAFLLLPLMHAGVVHGEQLTDPTRPPDQIGYVPSEAAPAGPSLQSVLISPQRRVAIISGKTVKVGDKFGSAHVVSITESEVVLRNGKEMQTLKLFPDVQKRLTSSGASTITDHRRQ